MKKSTRFLIYFLLISLINGPYFWVLAIHTGTGPVLIDSNTGAHSSLDLFLSCRNHYSFFDPTYERFYIFYVVWYNDAFRLNYSYTSDFSSWTENLVSGVGLDTSPGLGTHNVAGNFAVDIDRDGYVHLANYEEDYGFQYRYGTIQSGGSISWADRSYILNLTTNTDQAPYMDMCVGSDNYTYVIWSWDPPDPTYELQTRIHRSPSIRPSGSSANWTNWAKWLYVAQTYPASRCFVSIEPMVYTGGSQIFSTAIKDAPGNTSKVVGAYWSDTLAQGDNFNVTDGNCHVFSDDSGGQKFPQYSILSEFRHSQTDNTDPIGDGRFLHFIYKTNTITGSPVGDVYYKRYDNYFQTWTSESLLFSDSGPDTILHPTLSVIRPYSLDRWILLSAFRKKLTNGNITCLEYSNQTWDTSFTDLCPSGFEGWVSYDNHGDFCSMQTIHKWEEDVQGIIGLYWYDNFNNDLRGVQAETEGIPYNVPPGPLIPWDLRYLIIGLGGMFGMCLSLIYGGYRIKKGDIPEGIAYALMLFLISMGLFMVWLWR